jgi:hypothetical protein
LLLLGTPTRGRRIFDLIQRLPISSNLRAKALRKKRKKRRKCPLRRRVIPKRNSYSVTSRRTRPSGRW